MADVGGGTAVAASGAAPFLRWAGGKRWLLSHLPAIMGDFRIKRYHEPFVGGASVFLGLNPEGPSFLSDLNSELIETYKQVRDRSAAVARALALHPNEMEHYYAVRATRPTKAVDRAARFIYLNQTSFNGIYRVNLEGKYNVPFGNREWCCIPTAPHLAAVSKRLRTSELAACDFEEAIKKVKRGDFVFLDPPYTVAHNHNGFIKYNQKLFSFEDQRRLRKAVESIRERGAFYVLTNAAHESIAALFDLPDRRFALARRNTIGGQNAARGTATEYLFTNLPAPRGLSD